jgi:hypothetical protein
MNAVMSEFPSKLAATLRHGGVGSMFERRPVRWRIGIHDL